jgi:serine/threonine protein kinase
MQERDVMTSADPLIGTTVGGCEILEVIGQGGMGVIYKARQVSLDRIVAMKVLASHLAENTDFVQRFQREARAVAKINHPNILSVYDVGEEQHVNFMIMELIEGQSLAQTLKEHNGILPWEEGTDLIVQSARGLEAAQASGIVHRDIKPENLMLTKKGVIKVSDFGLAKDENTVTMTESMMGTPAYMSPEQCDGKVIDGRSDVYSLGGTFYRLITGHLPFEADTAMSMMFRHKHEALIAAHEVVKSIPPSISAVITKMMAKKREQRYQTMTDVLDAIDQACNEKSGVAIPPPSSSDSFFNPDDSQIATQGGGGFSFDATKTMAPAPAPGTGDDAYGILAKGEDCMARGDRVGGMKFYFQALQSRTLDQSTRARIEQDLRKELNSRRQAADNFLRRGMLVEAGREYRVLSDINPSDEALKTTVKDLDNKLAQRRTLENDVRTAIASGHFDKAIKLWDAARAELRTEGVGKQVENLRSVILPSFQLSEQGEKFNKSGQLEEAIICFEDALKINPTCEPARVGVGDAKQKLFRIDHMLKEGYQFSLEQNYAKAVEAWKPILSLRPGHPQTVKCMIDAYVALGQRLRLQGDTEGAVHAYREATQTDPQNRNVRKLLDDLTVLYDKERVLLDRANDAVKRGRVGQALKSWKEIHRLNPSNKKAGQQIAQLARQRSRKIFTTIIVLILLAVGGTAGFQFLNETRLLSQSQKLIDEGKYEQAADVIKNGRFYLYKNHADERREDAIEKGEEHKAVALESANEYVKASEVWVNLADRIRRMHPGNSSMAALADGNERKGLLCRLTRFEKLGEAAAIAAIKDRGANPDEKWKESSEFYAGIPKAICDFAKPDPGLDSQRATAEEKVDFIGVIVDALGKEKSGAKQQARTIFERASLKTQVLPLPGMDDFIVWHLKKLATAKVTLLSDGMDALSRVNEDGSHPGIADAITIFDKAIASGNDVKQAEDLQQYAKDLAFCEDKTRDMRLVTQSSPIRGGAKSWGARERKASFCVDRFEYPNTPGSLPKTNVTLLEAQADCTNAGKILCPKDDWLTACRGGDDHTMPFSYGMARKAGTCNDKSDKPEKSGERSGCRNAIGVYDMSGNVAEWVDDQANNAFGGSYHSGDDSRCDDNDTTRSPTGKHPDVGFRCCTPRF